jgi:hypothetical protein
LLFGMGCAWLGCGGPPEPPTGQVTTTAEFPNNPLPSSHGSFAPAPPTGAPVPQAVTLPFQAAVPPVSTVGQTIPEGQQQGGSPSPVPEEQPDAGAPQHNCDQ